MEFRIADTFTASLARLAGDEQKQVKLAVYDLQTNAANPGAQLHRLDRAKDPRFWSVRVSRDIRIIVHRTDSSLLLCYVDHHDDAYRWAQRRKLETHPTTGAAQMVELHETVREVEVVQPVVVPAPPVEAPSPVKGPALKGVGREDLLGYGVPPEWLEDALRADEDGILDLATRLPAEAGEALLVLATGGKPEPVTVAAPGADPFQHPDALRRFRTIENEEELQLALDFPWERWAIFLHPTQRDLVEREFSGPARVAGTAGTGKTVVALHRAAHLARANEDGRVLLTTFSPTLTGLLREKVRRLLGGDPRINERVDVLDLGTLVDRLHRANIGPLRLADEAWTLGALERAMAGAADVGQSRRFVAAEWAEVVDAWQVRSWEEYRDVRRLGRKLRLPESQRQALWRVFSRVRDELAREGLVTLAEACTNLADDLVRKQRRPYDFMVVDEAQDLGVPQLRLLAAMGAGRPNTLFFAGDLGQRIFQSPFSWLSLGVDVRGRSRTLRLNYRTSHQIRTVADRLLGPTMSDVDGIEEVRTGAVSAFNGPEPEVRVAADIESEAELVAAWISRLTREGVRPTEIAVFVRSKSEVSRAEAAIGLAGATPVPLGSQGNDGVWYGTMHSAKGLEFRAVAVMGVEDEIIPSQERIALVSDPSDLEEVYTTERNLLYVACTRARDHLLVTSGGEPSEFLEDFKSSRPHALE